MGSPLPDGIDLRRTFRSKHLEGLWGIRAYAAAYDWMCGAAAMAAALGYLTIHVNQHQVAQGTGTTKIMGTPWKGILQYAGKHRVRATVTKETPAQGVLGVLRTGKPVLLEWGDWPGHWVLLTGWDAPTETLVLLDPSRSPAKTLFVGYPWAQFISHWEGMTNPTPRIAITFKKATVTRSKKGLEERSDYRLATWDYVHGSKNRARQ